MTDVLAFTSKPTVDIVAEKDRLVVREKKVLKNVDTFGKGFFVDKPRILFFRK